MTTETNQSELEKLLADSEEALKNYCEYKGIQYPICSSYRSKFTTPL